MMFIELNIKNTKNIKGKRAKNIKRTDPEQTEKTIGEHLKNKKEVLRAI